MTKTTVTIGGIRKENEDGSVTVTGGQTVALCTSAYLPILYRLLHHEDFLRKMDRLNRLRAKWVRESAARELRKTPAHTDESDSESSGTPDAETVPETTVSEENETTAPQADDTEVSVEAEAEEHAEEEDPYDALLEEMDLVFVARMEYTMARLADPTIPSSMEAWFSSLQSPSAVYDLMAPALNIYAEDGKATSVPKKKAGRRNGR